MRHALEVALVGLVLSLSSASTADEMSFPNISSADIPGAPKLGQPMLIMGSSRPIVTEKHGLASPALYDWDGDGLKDLLVGEFETNAGDLFPMREDGSTIRVYLNVGSNESPEFTDDFIWARDTEGTIMEVEQWCCVSFTPLFYDLDADGHLDMITGQYHPGEVTWFRGSEKGFEPGVKLPQEGDPASNGQPMWGNYEGEPGDIGTFDYWVYSTATFGDLDDDGDYDLIVGGSGGLRVSENIGGPENPSFGMRELLLDIHGEPLKTRQMSEWQLDYYERHPEGSLELTPPSGDIKTNPLAVDWDSDGVLDLLVTDSYVSNRSRAVNFFRGVKTPEGHRFEPAIELLRTEKGAKALPGSGNRVYVDDWNSDGTPDLIIGASVATVNRGEFSDELSWEWESVNRVEAAGKDPGRYPPRERPTEESLRSAYWEELSEEEIQEHVRFNQEYWDQEIGRLYEEGKEHWLTMRHQGRVYVMLGEQAEPSSQEEIAQETKAAPSSTPAPTTSASAPLTPPVTVNVDNAVVLDPEGAGGISINFDMRDGWYIYAPTGRNAKEGMIETSTDFLLPEGIEIAGNMDLPMHRFKGLFEIYSGKGVTWTQGIQADESALPGTHLVKTEVTYQTCKDDLCLPPRSERFQTAVVMPHLVGNL